MKLTANSVIHGVCPGRIPFTHADAIKALHAAGFEGMEINLAGSINEGNYLQQEDWKEKIEEIGKTAAECQMELSQSHLPFYNFADPAITDLDLKNSMFARSIEASGMLGVKWAVFHAGNAIDSVLGMKESKRRTMEFLKPYLELAHKCKVGIAVENLFIPTRLNKAHRYCSNVEDVCDLVDSLGEGVGVCWDFGHANLIGDDQVDCLKIVGNRLKVIHVHDNNSKHDDHQMPYTYCCTVEWERILPVLKEIGYEGNFNFEVVESKLPEDVRESYLKMLAQLGKHMMAMTGLR